ncbi:cytochrome c oxidase assembly protein [Alteromonas sp. C1M14]|uniref:cytochrome c oxidase assembly protein n=1 Tax=Alteromonas sp. C1M14 TaxID=2841567 RepID=UPI001C094685|nr:cytochrome c oxidase assembly protein [Alteromonas sp. C1M14]MBU2978376.1 cytochrome c oxidase assembly protein [Alteromonas sp. C1M14]
MATSSAQHRKLTLRLVIIVIGMFGFGFALVPLYDVFCDITGINGKTQNSAAVWQSGQIDNSRSITVEFITRTNSGMSWEFTAQTQRISVHPGEVNTVSFYVRNPARNNIIAQAIPSVSPGQAALYLNKTECFCFNQQALQAGQEAWMPMSFYVDPDLPEDITYFTLQYTLYDVTDRAADLTDNENPFLRQPVSGSR